MLVQYLGRCQIKVLLRYVHSSLSQRKHAGFCAHTLELSAGAAVHLLSNLGQVDTSCEIHGAGVDAQDVGTGFDAVK